MLAHRANAAVSLCALWGLVGCLYYDSSERCGPHMVLNPDAHICVCDEQSVRVPGGCEPCPKGREPNADKCICPAGTKEDDSGDCATISGRGDACDESSPCGDAVYDFCAVEPDATEGVCTKRCETDGDCDETDTCADWAASPYCKAFVGVAVMCSMPGLEDDACGGDADYCFMGQCFVRQCEPTPEHAKDDCPRGRKCCDVSFLGMPDVQTACVAAESTVCP